MTNKLASTVHAFIDLRSPYSYLSLAPARKLAKSTGTTFIWQPYITDFRSAYGGEVEERSSRDIAKLKYLYMDCRRLAKAQDLNIRPTTKLWNAELASKAMLFANTKEKLWEFLIPCLEAFWQREFDLESLEAIDSAIQNAGMDLKKWHAYLEMYAQEDLERALELADTLGVFGAPTFVYQEELFWGTDRIDLLEQKIRNPGPDY
jgi:2-hydroxychromene-2-carboxylate isomerase